MVLLDILTIRIWELILLVLILIAAYGAGSIFLRIFNFDKNKEVKDVFSLLSITLGLGVLAYLVLMIGLVGFLNQWALWVLVLVYASVGLRDLNGKNLSFNNFINIKNLDLFSRFLIFSFIFFAIINFIGAMAPPLAVDDIKYHFAIPKRYLTMGEISYIPDFAWSNLPFTMEMLWTLAIGIHSAELAQLLNCSIGILIVFWIISICKKTNLNLQNILISITLFYSITTVSELSQTGMVELGSTIFFIAGIYLLIVEPNNNKNYTLTILAGAFFGLFSATKILFIFMAGIIVFFYGFKHFKYNNSLNDGLRKSGIFGITILVVSGVWYLKAFIMTGNPIYPLLINYFGGIPENKELLGGIIEPREYYHTKQFPRTLLMLFPDILINPNNLRGHISPLFVALLPFLFIKKEVVNIQLNTISKIALLYFLFWIFLYPFIRIGLPLFILLSILISTVITNNFFQKKPLNLIIKSLLVLWLINSVSAQLRLTTGKLPVVFGTQDHKQYLVDEGLREKYKFYHYPAINFMNENLPKDSKVLLWSNDGYYLDRNYLYAIEFITRMANGDDLFDSINITKELKRFGITHVAMTDNYLRRPLKKIIEKNDKANIIFADNHMKIGILID